MAVSAGKTIQAIALLSGAALLMAGCGSGGGSKTTTTTGVSATPAALPNYDPCTQVPQTVLDSLQLQMKIPDEHVSGATRWEGCGWVRSNYYSMAIDVTNATVDQVRDHHYQDTQQFTVDGRSAISSRQVADHPMLQCTVNVTVSGGTLEFFLSKDGGAPEAANLDACSAARDAAQQVVPTLPAGL